jgi:hypothetical protein
VALNALFAFIILAALAVVAAMLVGYVPVTV